MGSKASITKAQIDDVAYERARENGLGSLTVRAVADACGVATGTIYNHVVDIAALRTEVLQRFWSRAVAGAKLDECARDAGTALEFCRRLSEALEQTLRGFRDNWLRDLGGLDARTRMRAAEAGRSAQRRYGRGGRLCMGVAARRGQAWRRVVRDALFAARARAVPGLAAARPPRSVRAAG